MKTTAKEPAATRIVHFPHINPGDVPEADRWKPIRRGVYYCSPGCSSARGCHYEDFELAGRLADALVTSLGGAETGWLPSVHENLGWHYGATHPSGLSVHESRQPDELRGKVYGYTCLTSSMLTGKGASAMAAVRNALKLMRAEVASWTAKIEAAEATIR